MQGIMYNKSHKSWKKKKKKKNQLINELLLFDGFMQELCNSRAEAMELHLTC